MKVAYVAGPYRASSDYYVRQDNRRAEEVAAELWQMGYAVICPHKNTAGFGGLMPDETWLIGGLAIIEHCDLVVVVPGWVGSESTKDEIKRAASKDIPVFFWTRHQDQLERLAHVA